MKGLKKVLKRRREEKREEDVDNFKKSRLTIQYDTFTATLL